MTSYDLDFHRKLDNMADYSGLSDHELLGLMTKGNQLAFECLFDRYTSAVFKFCYSILLDHQSAEDATQDVFVKVWHKGNLWQPGDATFKTWVLTLARHHCFDVLRKLKSENKKHQGFFQNLFSFGSSHQEMNSVEKSLDQVQYSDQIKDIIFTLPERQREAVTLVYYMDIQNVEAAGIMNIKPAAFDSLLARARRELKKKVANAKELQARGLNYETK